MSITRREFSRIAGGGNQLFQWDKHGHGHAHKSGWTGIIKGHDWTAESLMLLIPFSSSGGNGGSISPQLLLANVEDRLNAVGPVIAVCQ